MKSDMPEEVRKFADTAYAAAIESIDRETATHLADTRALMGALGASQSSSADRESAMARAKQVKAHTRARADALMEGYELYAHLNEDAAAIIIEDVTTLYESTIKRISGTAISDAKSQAWRARANTSGAVAKAQEFGLQIEQLSSPVLNEITCEIERRRLTPKADPPRNISPIRAAAVRPIGPYGYHPEIARVSQRLCEDGNFRQAVLDAFIHVIHTVRMKSGLPQDGDDLMNRAFSPDGRTPPVRFNTFQTDGEKNEQRGIWLLFKGIVGLRNFKAHIVTTFDDPHRSHEYLALASLLLRLLDSATIDAPLAPPTPSP
jgi:uncharacterized protein (TIGR02391 family)